MKKNKTIITVTGIRPDFIRMSEIFKKLDRNYKHILIHTGQHFDKNLSEVFFKDLKIRKPDYNLKIGAKGRDHFIQSSLLDVRLLQLIKRKKFNPNLIIFLGDSNSVCSAVSLKKEGYNICHIEAGMRSYDRRMLEEINRTICDHCSEILMVYHQDYKNNLIKENIPSKKIHVVGNTIKEVLIKNFSDEIKNKKTKNYILVDIHRPENFKNKTRLKNIFNFLKLYKDLYPNNKIYFLKFKRTLKQLRLFKISTDKVNLINLLGYLDFLKIQRDAQFILSDSGTAQEEPALLKTPVLVPRDYTERPQSYLYKCSKKLNVNYRDVKDWKSLINWTERFNKLSNKDISKWLGNGKTSDLILSKINVFLTSKKD